MSQQTENKEAVRAVKSESVFGWSPTPMVCGSDQALRTGSVESHVTLIHILMGAQELRQEALRLETCTAGWGNNEAIVLHTPF